MAYGMGFVFCFLTLLVAATSLMSYVITRYFPQAAEAPASNARPQAPAPAADGELIAVISAAIHQFRARQK